MNQSTPQKCTEIRADFNSKYPSFTPQFYKHKYEYMTPQLCMLEYENVSKIEIQHTIWIWTMVLKSKIEHDTL